MDRASSRRLDAALQLLESYLHKELTFPDLFQRYKALFIQSSELLNDDVFKFLDGIWADMDVTTEDRTLIGDNPKTYIDEAEFKALLKCKLAAAKAAGLGRNGGRI